MTEIIIKTHDVHITKSIKEYVEKKLSKVEHFFDNIQEIQVDLDVESLADQNERQIATASVFVPGSVLIAKESTKNLYASIDGVLDKLVRQLKKHKQKMRLKNRKEAMKTKRSIQRLLITETNEKNSNKKNIPESNYYNPRPMHPEDAALLLEESEQLFLVFRNASDEKINVIFVSDDGNFGLVET